VTWSTFSNPAPPTPPQPQPRHGSSQGPVVQPKVVGSENRTRGLGIMRPTLCRSTELSQLFSDAIDMLYIFPLRQMIESIVLVVLRRVFVRAWVRSPQSALLIPAIFCSTFYYPAMPATKTNWKATMLTITPATRWFSWMGRPSIPPERPGFNSGLEGKLSYRLHVYTTWSSDQPPATMQWRGA
jgi:hypothetical protein